LPDIYIDADACPVKYEVFRVAGRYKIKVILTANAPMRLPPEYENNLVVVSGEQDAADDWIVEHAAKNDIVITADIPLAARCLKNGARVLEPKGYVFTEATISNALANRDIMTYLRNTGMETGGPAAFQKRDRSRFLQSLDKVIRAIIEGK
jgi:uncharacterized protein